MQCGRLKRVWYDGGHCQKTYGFETGKSRLLRKLAVSERQQPSARRNEAVDGRGKAQYQNEVVETAMMEAGRVANWCMGWLLKEVGGGGCTGQQLQAQGKTGSRGRRCSGISALGIDTSDGNR